MCLKWSIHFNKTPDLQLQRSDDIIVKGSAPISSYFQHSKCLILYLDFADLKLQGLEIVVCWFNVSFA